MKRLTDQAGRSHPGVLSLGSVVTHHLFGKPRPKSRPGWGAVVTPVERRGHHFEQRRIDGEGLSYDATRKGERDRGTPATAPAVRDDLQTRVFDKPRVIRSRDIL